MAGKRGNDRSPLKSRKDDLYETPGVAVRALLSVETLPQYIWEPACGPGNIVNELHFAGHDVFSTDLVDYGCPGQLSGIDFLMLRSVPEQGEACSAIVTNPPFKLANEFVAHALTLAPKVVMLLRLAFLESERRTPILDNGLLRRIYVFRKRLPMMHRAEWAGRKANSGMAFAWFVWDRVGAGPTTIQRISWEPFADKELTPEQSRKDSHDSYYEAVSEIRRRGVIEGKYEPINDEEKALALKGNS
jgi:hypothetical protein